jgi:hypothetical protein
VLAERPEPSGSVRPGHLPGRLLEHSPRVDQEVVEFAVLGEQVTHDHRVGSVDRRHRAAS